MNKNNRFVFTLIAFIVSAFAHQASASPAAVIFGGGPSDSACCP